MPCTQTGSRHLIFVIELAMKIPYPPTAPSYTDRQWRRFLEPVRAALQGAGLQNCTIKMKPHNDFRTWCITDNLDDRYWFDIVSPKLSYYNQGVWRHQLCQIYAAIRSIGMSPSELWATKIHVAANPVFLQKDLNAIAQTVLLHTHGFNALAWDLWGGEVHTDAQPLIWVPLSHLHMSRCFNDIQSAGVTEDIAKAMNPEGAERGRMRAWNFWPLVDPTPDPKYNLASASKTIEDALTWINLVCLFVRGALVHNGEWPRGTLKQPDWPMFLETDLLKLVLEQADEVALSAAEKGQLQQRLACLADESRNRGGWAGLQVVGRTSN
ncbi:hypothetical protein F5Y14DRAFT_451346 [Nemania sp. NC0429]|nr:hypothetical protein F5Y14DRAFT_451346 [Nemania sp. NC0429]